MKNVQVLDVWAAGIWSKKDNGRVTVFITGRTPPGDLPKTGEPITGEQGCSRETYNPVCNLLFLDTLPHYLSLFLISLEFGFG